MKVLTYTLIAIIVLLLAFSAYSLAGSYFTRSSVVTVDLIKTGADCGPLKVGDKIISVGPKTITNSADFSSIVSTVKAGDYVAMVVNGGPGNCKAIGDGDLGFTVKETVTGGLKFGPDISETKSYIYSLGNANSSTLERSRKIIEERMNFYDFTQTRMEVVGDKIRIVPAFDDELNDLVRQGRIRGTVFESFKLEQGTAKVIVGNVSYILKPGNDSISINGTDFQSNKPFELSNVTFHFMNVTGGSMNLEAALYENEDVLIGSSSQVIVREDSKSGLYFYYIQVSVAPDINEKLTNIIKRAESVLVPSGGTLLNARLNYYVDDQMVSSLAIPVEMIGNQINAISGVEKTPDEAYNVGRIVYVSLKFGPLPTNLKLESQIMSEPSISKSVSYGTLGVGFILMLCVLGFTYVKIKRPKVVFWIFVLVLLELFISIGILVGMAKYLGIRTLIDFPVLIGISLLSAYLALTFFVYFEGLEGRHKHITIGYKKIISLMNFLRILLIGTVIVGIIGYRGMAFVLLVGFLVDLFVMKQFFRTLMKGKT